MGILLESRSFTGYVCGGNRTESLPRRTIRQDVVIRWWAVLEKLTIVVILVYPYTGSLDQHTKLIRIRFIWRRRRRRAGDV